MSALLDTLAIQAGNSVFHTEEFMYYISTHLKYLRENGASQVAVEKGLVSKFEYNFFSLLIELNYDFEDFMVLLLMNGFTDPTEMTREFSLLVLPNQEVLRNLKQLYQHQNKRI